MDGTFRMDRVLVTWRFTVTDNASMPVSGTKLVCVAPPANHDVAQLKVAGNDCLDVANGVATVSGKWWHKLDATPSYDVGASLVTVDKHNAPDRQTITKSVEYRAVGPTPPTLPIDVVLEVSKPASVVIRDAHTGAALTQAGGSAIPAKFTASSHPHTCGPVCSGDATTTFDLYEYDAATRYGAEVPTTSDPAGYLPMTSTGRATNVAPGGVADLKLFRGTMNVTVHVRDAHTGAPLSGARVAQVAAPGATYMCKPTGHPLDANVVCEASTGAGSNPASIAPAVLRVPWASATEACIEVAAGTYVVQHASAAGVSNPNNATAATLAERAAFQSARVCFDALPSDEAGAKTLFIFASRAASDIPVDLASATGGAAPVAQATPKLERAAPAFTCDPSITHSATRFPDCAGKAVTAGSVLRLPSVGSLGTDAAATPDASWNVLVETTAYNSERVRLHKGGAALALDLWPTEFAAALTIQETTPTGVVVPCGDGYAGTIEVELRNLRTGVVTTGAASKSGPTCVASPVLSWDRLTLTAVGHPKEVTNPDSTDPFLVTVKFGARSAATVVELGPKTAGTVNVFRAPTSGPLRVVGQVADTDVRTGQPAPVAGLVVKATRKGAECFGTGYDYYGVTDAQGNFVVPVACDGTYLVTLTPPNPLLASALYVADGPAKEATVSQVYPEARADFDLRRVATTLTLDARNVTDGAAPIAGIRVRVIGTDVDREYEGVTDDAGRLAFANVPWGPYRVDVDAPEGGQAVDMDVVVMPGASSYPVLVAGQTDEAG